MTPSELATVAQQFEEMRRSLARRIAVEMAGRTATPIGDLMQQWLDDADDKWPDVPKFLDAYLPGEPPC